MDASHPKARAVAASWSQRPSRPRSFAALVLAFAVAVGGAALQPSAAAHGAEAWTLVDVAPVPAACDGAPGATCPLVRPVGESEWRTWEGGIEGLDLVAGHAYRVLARGVEATGPLQVVAVLEDVAFGDVAWRIHAATLADERIEFGRDGDPRLRFDPVALRVYGTAGCNQLSAPYATVGGRQVAFGPIVSTLMMCADDVMRQERAVMHALDGALAYAIDGDLLHLEGAGGALWLAPEPSDRATAAGRVWPDAELERASERVAVAADAGEAWPFDPLRVALEWLPPMPEAAVVDVVRRDTHLEVAPYSVVSVTVGGLLDDSVAALRDVVVLERAESGHWRIVAATEAQRCARGDHVGWLGPPDLCP